MQQLVQVRDETAAAVIASGGNQGERMPRTIQLGLGGDAQQCSEIDEILRAGHVVAGQHLECNQVSRRGDAHRQTWQEIEDLGLGHDLRFDPGRGEQQIDDGCSWRG